MDVSKYRERNNVVRCVCVCVCMSVSVGSSFWSLSAVVYWSAEGLCVYSSLWWRAWQDHHSGVIFHRGTSSLSWCFPSVVI